MAQGLENIELEVFRQYYSSFVENIENVLSLANKLHENSLIDQPTYNKVTDMGQGLSQEQKATEVVKVLEKTVSVLKDDKKRKEKFDQILSIFGGFIPLCYIAENAREAYGEDINLKTLLLLGFFNRQCLSCIRDRTQCQGCS